MIREPQQIRKATVLKGSDVMRTTVEQITLDNLPPHPDRPSKAAAKQQEVAASEADRRDEKHLAELQALRNRAAADTTAAVAAERERGAQLRQSLVEQHAAQIEEIKADYQSFATSVSDALREYYEESEPLLIDLASGIARAVLERDLTEEDNAIIARSLSWSLERLAGEGHLDVHINETFASRLDELDLLPQTELPSLLRWHRSDDISAGDFVVVSPMSTIRRVKSEAFARAAALVAGEAPEEDEE